MKTAFTKTQATKPLAARTLRPALFAAALVAAPALAEPALAEPIHLGDLTIDHAWTRATPPNAPVGGAFMILSNSGAAPDRLTGGSASFASRVEVHEMKMDGEIMRMRPIEGGLEIPPGGSVELKPGGSHIMFMGLKERLSEGETRSVTLTFENAGDVTFDIPVETMNKGRMRMKQGGDQGMGHGTGHGADHSEGHGAGMQHGKTD